MPAFVLAGQSNRAVRGRQCGRSRKLLATGCTPTLPGKGAQPAAQRRAGFLRPSRKSVDVHLRSRRIERRAEAAAHCHIRSRFPHSRSTFSTSPMATIWSFCTRAATRSGSLRGAVGGPRMAVCAEPAAGGVMRSCFSRRGKTVPAASSPGTQRARSTPSVSCAVHVAPGFSSSGHTARIWEPW